MASDSDRLERAEAQVVMLTKERNTLRADNKRLAMKRGIFRALAEEMQAVVVPLEPLPPAPVIRKTATVQETLVMHLSDIHGDEVVEPHMVGGLEKFDMEVCLARAETYVDAVIKFAKTTLVNYKFRKLVILCYGDLTNGEIHGGVGHSAHHNQFRNSLAIGQMVALMVRDLASHFPEVEILCLSGNHGRRTPKKDYHGPWDNWDYMIAEIARLHCASLTNVKFHIPECWSIVTKIEGHDFYIAHGDDVKSWMSIPFYGIERKTRRLVSLHHATDSAKVRYFVFGHFHALTMSSDLNGETIINGAWVGTNPYSYESFAGYREPQQLIHGVHPDFGITWRLNVRLRSERDKTGPERYKVILAEKQ